MRTQKRAFTLIELLVVIAIIALLLSILVPSLALVKRKGATAVCLVNTKNLSLGWYMYEEDNDGFIMSSHNDENLSDTEPFFGWTGEPRSPTGARFQIQGTNLVTDEDEIRGIERGVLDAYLKSHKSYHCPMDNVRTSLYDGTRIYVSYAVPTALNNYRGHTPHLTRYHEITSPGLRYNFVEVAEPRNWNMSHHFVIGAPEYTGSTDWGWWGPLAINHGDSSIMGFCDGHAETRKWRDPFTIERVNKLQTQGGTGGYGWGEGFPPPEQTSDINYMARGWAYRDK